jgi:hypothetical protein
MPGGIQLEFVSASVNTQTYDNIQSALTVKFHSHARVQALDFAPLRIWRHICESFQFKTACRLVEDIV